MIGNKIQPYTYTLKTSGVTDTPFCQSYKLYLYLTPPENALSLENLKMHIRVLFDASIPAGYRKIVRVGIQNSLDGLATPTHKRYFDVDISADANRIIDYSIDVTSLIKKDNVQFWAGDQSDYPDETNYIYVEFPPEILNYYNYPTVWKLGDIQLWKADGLFTIKEIR
jgi:hypothetical protein